MDRKKKRILKALVILSFGIIFGFFIFSSLYATIYSSISGKVIAEDTGQGLEGVQVWAILVGGGHEESYYASTDNKGNFVLRDLISGSYILGFEKGNSIYLSEYPHVEVVLPKGKHVVNMNYILKLGGSISGMVYDSDGGTPVSEAGIYATVPNTQFEWIDSSRYVGTDSNGKFLLQGLPESENCTVQVSIQGHAYLKKTVKITKGQVTENINFVITWNNITGINGYVNSSIDEKPIIDAKVELTDSSGNDIAFARTDVTGSYSIVGISPGVYRATAYWAESANWIDKTNIVIESGMFTTVNFQFALPTPESKNMKNIWERFYGLFISDAFAQGGTQKKFPEPEIKKCGDNKTKVKAAWEKVKKTILKNPGICISDPYSSHIIGNKTLRQELEEKIQQHIIIECVGFTSKYCQPKGKCIFYCKPEGKCIRGTGAIGGEKIFLCPAAFSKYKVGTKTCDPVCLEGTIFHELIHLTQSAEMSTDAQENQAYGCEGSCFHECSSPPHIKKYENAYKSRCCD